MDELSDELAAKGLELMRGYTRQIRLIADPLRLAAVDECGDHRVPYLGAILESVDQGASTPLGRAREREGIAASPTVVDVLPDTPAERAGLLPGDVIVSVSGTRVIGPRDLSEWQWRAAEEDFELEILRGNQPIQIPISFVAACTGMPGYSASDAILPAASWQDRVFVPRGLIEFAENQDQIASLIAHAMAHLILEQLQPTLKLELRADALALRIMTAAGRDTSRTARIWERIAFERPWLIANRPRVHLLHGAIAARLESLRNQSPHGQEPR